MYGLVNAAIQELVTTKFGKEKWSQIRRKAEVDVEMFSRMTAYPDEITYRLVGAASEVLQIPADDVIRAFGEFWVLYTGKQGYGHLFGIAGRSLRDFLCNLDNLHTRVGQNFPELRPPSFRFDDVQANPLHMHYHAERKGLCPMIFGLLDGLARHFETRIRVEHPVCARNGADHCEFLIWMDEMDKNVV